MNISVTSLVRSTDVHLRKYRKHWPGSCFSMQCIECTHLQNMLSLTLTLNGSKAPLLQAILIRICPLEMLQFASFSEYQ